MCVTLGCELYHSTAYHPQVQGLIELFNKTLKTSLKCHEEPSEWYDQLPWTLLALRNMPKEDLDFSTPSDLLFGQPVRLPGEFFESVSEDAFNINSSSFAQSLSHYMQQIPYFAPRRTKRAHYVDKALPSSFSKRLLVFFHSDIRQVFLLRWSMCILYIYIPYCTFDFCCYFDFVLLVLRLLLPSLLFSFYFLCGEDCSDAATLVGDCL